ncbi:hypothetical protein [Vibrio pectenicida]|uniref:Uncharacterized protein n=1 Tax=Vibrio pectenicida TaxID=62763 RepID=A0A3R9ECM1_9VIBR|nr:hypothetical protein [Vibrio pectenicida]RSD30928.1 hypothetical protein EJA03_11225 [Vibrio pectenicida]
MELNLIAALIGISGVFLGALVQYVLAGKAAVTKRVMELRTDAYCKFVDSVSSIAVCEPSEHAVKLENLNQAKTRVILIGSQSVVSKLEVFFTRYGVLSSTEAELAFTEIIQAMRNDLSKTGSLELVNLHRSLFNVKP